MRRAIIKREKEDDMSSTSRGETKHKAVKNNKNLEGGDALHEHEKEETKGKTNRGNKEETSGATTTVNKEENKGATALVNNEETNGPTTPVKENNITSFFQTKKPKAQLIGDKDAANFSPESIHEFVGDCVSWLSKQTMYNTDEVQACVKFIYQSYFVFKSQKDQIAKTLCSAGFAGVIVKMVKSIQVSEDFEYRILVHALAMNFSNISLDLSKSFGEEGLIGLLFNDLKQQPNLDNVDAKQTNIFIEVTLGALHNISKVPEVKNLFREENALQILTPFLSVTKEVFQGLAAMTLANIVDEKENDILEKTGCFTFLSTCLKKALQNKESHEYDGFSAEELAEGFAHLAVNDNNKLKLEYFEFKHIKQEIIAEGVLPSLVIMMKGNIAAEQKMAAKCCWTLSFDKQARQKLKDEEGCITALEALAESDQKEVQKMAAGALWKIHGKGERKAEKIGETRGDQTKKHVFVSYNHKHKEIVHKIANRLQDDGYTLWIDRDNMGGSTIEAMASAVENAAVIVICMSENYKLSPACQSEAEYAFRCRVPFIPLMMQRQYKPDGWLGLVLGAKLYIEFYGKITFDLAYQRLTKELKNNIKPKMDVIDGPIQPQTANHLSLQPSSQVQHDTRSWKKDDVKRWLCKHDLERYKEKFEDYDGKALLGIKKIRDKAPEFFYSEMKKEVFKKLIDLVRFSEALDELG